MGFFFLIFSFIILIVLILVRDLYVLYVIIVTLFLYLGSMFSGRSLFDTFLSILHIPVLYSLCLYIYLYLVIYTYFTFIYHTFYTFPIHTNILYHYTLVFLFVSYQSIFVFINMYLVVYLF